MRVLVSADAVHRDAFLGAIIMRDDSLENAINRAVSELDLQECAQLLAFWVPEYIVYPEAFNDRRLTEKDWREFELIAEDIRPDDKARAQREHHVTRH